MVETIRVAPLRYMLKTLKVTD